MARVKFGSVVTEGHGSLGGHTFQSSPSGSVLRTKPINKGRPSFAQSLIRSYNPQLQAGWRALSDAQRDIWSRFAVTHQVNNKNGDPHPLSGHSLWMKYNFECISRGCPFITDPFSLGPPFFGPELIFNGGFDSPAGWSLSADFSISAGKCHYANTIAAQFNQPQSIAPGTALRVSFSISNCSGLTKARLYNQDTALPFSPSFPSILSLPNGIYTYDTVALLSITTIRFYAFVWDSSFSIDNFSFRQLFE